MSAHPKKASMEATRVTGSATRDVEAVQAWTFSRTPHIELHRGCPCWSLYNPFVVGHNMTRKPEDMGARERCAHWHLRNPKDLLVGQLQLLLCGRHI